MEEYSLLQSQLTSVSIPTFTDPRTVVIDLRDNLKVGAARIF